MAVCRHVPGGFLAYEKNTLEIGVDDLVPVFLALKASGASTDGAGVVHQDCNRTQLCLCMSKGRFDRFQIRHIKLDRDCAAVMACDFFLQVLELFDTPCRDRDTCTRLGEC